MGSDKITKYDTAKRRRWLLNRRREGKTMRTIAEEAEEEIGEENLPGGWGPRYVSKDIQRALDKVRDEVAEVADEYRTIQISRLENLLEQLWPLTREHKVEEVDENGDSVIVTKPPDVRAVDRVLAIMDRLNSFYDVEKAPDLGGESDGDTNIFVQVNQELRR